MSARPQNPATESVETLVDRFLAEQRQLTAVEKFSQRHADRSAPLLADHYRDLLPLSAPRPGEQYAFEVDLDRCSSCKACVSACHSLNGLDEDETWRDVGLLVGREAAAARARLGDAVATTSNFHLHSSNSPPLALTVTTACHHCVEPGCLEGCPVLAYDKDPITGIVRHLDDQCIGCSYCILKCPYEVPKYSKKRGIVRKCDLCHGRLAEGEAPACVQACPNEAIRITLVEVDALRREHRGVAQAAAVVAGAPPSPMRAGSLALPGAPDPGITVPTTVYRSTRPLAGLQPADHAWLRPAEAHLPLVWMLVLTQWGAGMLMVVALACVVQGTVSERALMVGGVGFALVQAGLVASVFHLGQPLKAWRVWMGWRRSWLSREAMVLGALAGFSAIWLSLAVAPRFGWMIPPVVLRAAAALVVLIVPAAVWAQCMVYVDTRRQYWRRVETVPRFFGLTLMAGLFAWQALVPGWVPVLSIVVTAGLLAQWEFRVFRHDREADRDALARTAWLLKGPLAGRQRLRMILLLAGGLVAAGGVGFGWGAALAGGLLVLAGGWLERSLFFTAVSPDRMPGPPGGGSHGS